MNKIIRKLFPHYYLRRQIKALSQSGAPYPSKEGLKSMLERLPNKPKSVLSADERPTQSFIFNMPAFIKLVPAGALVVVLIATGLWLARSGPSNPILSGDEFAAADLPFAANDSTQPRAMQGVPASLEMANPSAKDFAEAGTSEAEMSALFSELDRETTSQENQALASEYDNNWFSEEDSNINDYSQNYDTAAY